MAYKIVTRPMIENGEVPVGTKVKVLSGEDNPAEYGEIVEPNTDLYISARMDCGGEENFMVTGFANTPSDEEDAYVRIYKLVGDVEEKKPKHQKEKMTMRDKFASNIIVGLMGSNWQHKIGDDDIIDSWVNSAYIIADKMMERRNKVD